MPLFISPTEVPHSLHFSLTRSPSASGTIQPQQPTPALMWGMIGNSSAAAIFLFSCAFLFRHPDRVGPASGSPDVVDTRLDSCHLARSERDLSQPLPFNRDR